MAALRELDRRKLMAEAQAGNGDSYRALLKGCVPLVRAVARTAGVPADRIDDAVQDVLLTIHRVRNTYDPARPFDPWLVSIAKRRAIDITRGVGRRQSREVYDEAAYEAHPDHQDDGEAALDSRDQASALHEAIARLPEAQQQAVRHLSLGERTLAEAAALTGRSEGALKVNLHRALHSLRRLLGQEERP